MADQGGADDTAMRQNQIWTRGICALAQTRGEPIAEAVLGPVNEIIDITGTRWLAARIRPPTVIFVLLVGMALVCGFLGGYSLGVARRRHVLHAIAFSMCISSVIYLTLDVEFPHAGVIQERYADEVLVKLLRSMQPES